ncbi:MAG: 30S ribosomal protein S16 [Gammaproteobacteria bacterium]|nr:30S ribosomal protein S16 [Gammaproteobacteria bacterium]
MVVIRLSRKGAKKRPFYHIVVADKRCSRDGRFIEKIGFLNLLATKNETRLEIDLERAKYWISQGAQPSDRVATLIKEFQMPKDVLEKKQAKKAKKQAAQKAKKALEEAAQKSAKAQAAETETPAKPESIETEGAK